MFQLLFLPPVQQKSSLLIGLNYILIFLNNTSPTAKKENGQKLVEKTNKMSFIEQTTSTSKDPFTRSDFKDALLGSENWKQALRRSDFKVPFPGSVFVVRMSEGHL